MTNDELRMANDGVEKHSKHSLKSEIENPKSKI